MMHELPAWFSHPSHRARVRTITVLSFDPRLGGSLSHPRRRVRWAMVRYCVASRRPQGAFTGPPSTSTLPIPSFRSSAHHRSDLNLLSGWVTRHPFPSTTPTVIRAPPRVWDDLPHLCAHTSQSHPPQPSAVPRNRHTSLMPIRGHFPPPFSGFSTQFFVFCRNHSR